MMHNATNVRNRERDKPAGTVSDEPTAIVPLAALESISLHFYMNIYGPYLRVYELKGSPHDGTPNLASSRNNLSGSGNPRPIRIGDLVTFGRASPSEG